MGTKQSRSDKATSPYSSWGSSIDNLLCGPGKICEDQWTPVSTRANSLMSLRRNHEPIKSRNRRRVQSHDSYRTARYGQADIFTLDREYSYDDQTEVYTHQPLPSEIISSPLNDIDVVHKGNRRGSYFPKGISQTRRPYTSLSLTKELTTVVKKKRRKATNRKSLPVPPPQPIQIFIDLNGTQQQIKLDRNSRAKLRVDRSQKPISISKRSERLAKSSSPVRSRKLAEHNSLSDHLRSSNLGRSVPELRNHRVSGNKKKRKNKITDVIPFSKASASVSGSSNSTLSTRRVIPPRNKLNEAPPLPFRIKSVPDKPFTRIPTGKKDQLREGD